MTTLHKYIPDDLSVRKLIAMGMSCVCAYAVFARGGTVVSMQWPIWVFTFAIVFGVLFLKPEGLCHVVGRIGSDTVFRFGIIFTVLLLSQLVISDFRLIGFDDGAVELSREAPSWLPWSVSRPDAAEMLLWFVPLFVMVLLAKNLFSRRHAKIVFYVFSWTSLLLGLIGILQFLLGAEHMLGIWTIPGDMFFSTFDYVNHAAAWFYMNGFLTGGLFVESLKKKRPIVQTAVWGGIFLVCVSAGILSSSRFGAFVSLGLLGYVLIFFTKYIHRRVKGRVRLNIYISIGIVCLLGIALFFGAGGGRLSDEIRGKRILGEKNSLISDVKGRWIQYPPAWEIVKNNPLFGAGGWSYAWLAQLYIFPEDYEEWQAIGKANVHCDPLQFISEFGLLGFVCLLGIVAALIKPVIRLAFDSHELAIWILVGCLLVVFHSFFDLPFRCPAILYEWGLLLALVPVYYKVN